MLKFVLGWFFPLQTVKIVNRQQRWAIEYQAILRKPHPRLQEMMEAAITRIENHLGAFSSDVQVLLGSSIILQTSNEVEQNYFNAQLKGGAVIVTCHTSKPKRRNKRALFWSNGTTAIICIEKNNLHEMHMKIANCLAKARLRELGTTHSIDEGIIEGIAAFCETDSGVSLSVNAVISLVEMGVMDDPSDLLMAIPECWAQVFTAVRRDGTTISDLLKFSKDKLPDVSESLEFAKATIEARMKD